MSLILVWLGLPVALGLLSLGSALALERLSATRIPAALLLPAGLATIIVVAQALTVSDATAGLATPAVVVLAACGLALGRRGLRRVASPWMLAAALVYLAYGAPVLATGANGFVGYIKLDDTATWLAIVDRVMTHGRDLHGLAPSTYEATLAAYLPGGYPLGAFMGLGVAKQVLGTDPMWLFAPFCAYAAAMLAAALYTLTDGIVASARGRVAVAAIAAQPATLYAYTMWGGIKEVVVAALLPLVAALAGERRSAAREGGRALLPLAVACAAVLATLSAGAVVWLAPLVLPALVGVRAAGAATTTRRRRPALRWRSGLWLAGMTAACSIPVLLLAETFLRPLFMGGPGGGGVFTSQVELGNLVRPLRLLQLAGIWPAGDFRLDPAHHTVTSMLVVAAVTAGIVGVVLAWRRGDRVLVAYVLGTIGVCLAIRSQGSPWVDAKSLAEASPAVVFAALTGAALMFGRRDLRLAALLAGVLVASGVLWSNALAYREVNLAPHGQLAELEQISKLAAGQGPTLMTEFSSYGARHILRAADAESASELRRRQIPLRNGSLLPKGAHADVDEIDPTALQSYRSLVLRRSPTASRPPSDFRLRWSGRYYEFWQRAPAARPPSEHLALGTSEDPGAVPTCADVQRLARKAGPSGRLATVFRHRPAVLDLGSATLPAGWSTAGDREQVYYRGPGTIDMTMTLMSKQNLGVWLAGSTRGTVALSVDGRIVGRARQQLNWAGGSIPLGSVRLAAGRHRIALRYDDRGPQPGNRGQELNAFSFGPLVFARETAELPVTTVTSAQAGRLCGRDLDWIEALPAR
ncbi:MAG TPA: hypothetical protein VHZ75_11380 [Solirubrobacteraceae bacterium]|nr:hypothetical protein [Solirubrobacteraceae bacterium]